MIIESHLKKSDLFKLLFEQKLKPIILRMIEDNENKVILSKNFINEKLEIRYDIHTLSRKIKESIFKTDLESSVNKRNEEITFFKSSEEITRKSDLFKFDFENKVLPIILEEFKSKSIISFDEKYLKNSLKIECTTENMYAKIRKILNEDIILSVRKNVFFEGKKINEFIFKKVIQNNKKSEIDEDKIELEKYFKEKEEEESIKNKEINNKLEEEDSKIFNDLISEFNKKEGISNVKSQLKNVNYNTEFFLCSKCKEGKITYYNNICSICNQEYKFI